MTVKGSLTNFHPSRRRVYSLGDKYLAVSPTPDPNDSIKYVGNNLEVSLCFRSKDNAKKFEFDFCAQFTEDVVDDLVQTKAAACEWPSNGTDVERSQYKVADSESPHGSAITFTTTEAVGASSPLAQYQMIEHSSVLNAMTCDGCHIVDSALCDEVGICSKSNKSNYFALSPGIHRMFDGHGGAAPTMYIEALEYDERVFLVDINRKKRVRVPIRVHFRDADAYRGSGIRFTDITTRVDDTTFELYVHVLEPDVFKRCNEWKMGNTKEQWDV